MLQLINYIEFFNDDYSAFHNHKIGQVSSENLGRKVRVDVFLPSKLLEFQRFYKRFFLNDGQDYKQLDLLRTLDEHNEKTR